MEVCLNTWEFYPSEQETVRYELPTIQENHASLRVYMKYIYWPGNKAEKHICVYVGKVTLDYDHTPSDAWGVTDYYLTYTENSYYESYVR